MLDPLAIDLLLRVGVAAIAGALVGLERELRGHVAGIRTHALVAVGAAMFATAGITGSAAVVGADPTRVAAQVVSGIGFVGAGAILRDKSGVRGLTTASTIWVSGGLGVSAVISDLPITFGGMALVLIILSSRKTLNWLLPLNISTIEVRMVLEYELGHGTIGPLIQAVQETDSELLQMSMVDEQDSDPPTRRAEIAFRIPEPEFDNLDDVIAELSRRTEVRSVEFSSGPVS